MSLQYKESSEVPNDVLINRLIELSDAVISRMKGDSTPMEIEFTCRIPAEVDRDVDIVLREVARRLRKINQLEQECNQLKIDNTTLIKSICYAIPYLRKGHLRDALEKAIDTVGE